MQQITRQAEHGSGNDQASRGLPPIGCYVNDEYARRFQVQTGVGDPFYKSRKRRSLFPFLLLGLIAAGGLWFGFHRHLGAHSEVFNEFNQFAGRALELIKFPIEQVHIVGHERTDEKNIVDKLGPVWDRSLITINTSSLQKKIETLPWVRQAIVERVFPHGLNVFIKERSVIGRWVTLEGRFAFDIDGVVIERLDVGAFRELPIYEGQNAPSHAHELISALGSFPALQQKFNRFQWVDDRRWSLVMPDGLKVMLPARQIASGLTRLKALQEQYDILNRDLAFVDLRLSDRVTIRPKRSQNIRVLSRLEDLVQKGKINTDSLSGEKDGI